MPLESLEPVIEESIQRDTNPRAQPDWDEPVGDVSLSQRDSEDSPTDNDLVASTSHALESYYTELANANRHDHCAPPEPLTFDSYSPSISGASLSNRPPPTTARVPARYVANRNQLGSGRVLQSGIPSEPGASQQVHPATNTVHGLGVGSELDAQHLPVEELITGLTSPNHLPPIDATMRMLFGSNHRHGDSQLRPASDQSVLQRELPQGQGANQQATLRTDAEHGKGSKPNTAMNRSAGSKYTQAIKSPLKHLKRKLNSNSDQPSSSERPKFSSTTQAIGNIWRRNQGAAAIPEEREREAQGGSSISNGIVLVSE